MLAQLLPVGAIALSYLHFYAEAAPGFAPRSASSLTKRANTFVGCNQEQRTKAGQAAADMANLALHAYSEANTGSYGQAFTMPHLEAHISDTYLRQFQALFQRQRARHVQVSYEHHSTKQ